MMTTMMSAPPLTTQCKPRNHSHPLHTTQKQHLTQKEDGKPAPGLPPAAFLSLQPPPLSLPVPASYHHNHQRHHHPTLPHLATPGHPQASKQHKRVWMQ